MNKDNSHDTKNYEENRSNLRDHNKDKGVKDFANSYINAVKGGTQSVNVECSQPALVLDELCFLNHDFSLSLVGKLKEFDSLPNLKKILEEEGKIFWIRVKEVSGWAPDFSNSNDDSSELDNESIEDKSKDGYSDKDNEAEEILETVLEVEEPGEIKCSAMKKSKKEDLEDVHSDDPFNLYNLLEKTSKPQCYDSIRRGTKVSTGVSPKNSSDTNCHGPDNQVHGTTVKEHGSKVGFKEDVSYSVSSSHFKKETKMEKVDLFDIRSCWGNLTFDFVVGPSVGNSGGILCVWDSNMFHKKNSTISDYFIAILGKWLPNDKNFFIISVYAPQELSEKMMLWQYLVHVIEGWKGDVIVMGDFNEVRTAEERFGSIFNACGVAAFNSFIPIGGLVEVPSGGYSYTWAHKSAAKMSKLDRFLISEYLMRNCPNISSIILDRYLSDHRPILLREIRLDYGPTPFRFFHHWFELNGFDSFVTEVWKEINIQDPNAMLKLAKKLNILKGQVHLWVKDKKDKATILKNSLKKKLANIDSLLDNGEETALALEDRLNAMNNLTNLERMKLIELAQKAKIKWSIEGDENSKYFHGIINKQHNNLAIRGIIVDGQWIEDPVMVKNEFFAHFKERFDSPCKNRLILDMIFPNKLSTDQIFDLERPFSTEEIKGAVWDCGLNKSSSPDGGSILVNGSPTSEFQFYKGLKQGDPLSPLLFILVMESLHLWFHNVVTAGLFNDCFFRASGLRINLHKSKLIGIAMDSFLVDDTANKIGCMAIKLPFSYLGINIDPNVRKMTFVKWNNVLASKEKGGLGVPSFYGLNRALIFKWIWLFRSQNNSLWSRVIKALYGVDGKLGSKPCCSSNWSEIIQVIPSLYNKGGDGLCQEMGNFRCLQLGALLMIKLWQQLGLKLDGLNMFLARSIFSLGESSMTFFQRALTSPVEDVNMTEMSSYEEWWAWISNLRYPSKIKKIFE
ncbi:RNA-directed DNA polymerase, eukaryota [Tanacetum coccineum]